MSKFRAIIMTSAVIASMYALPALAADFSIHKNHINFNGKSYFTLDAQEIKIGDWGRKVTPIAGRNGLDRVAHLKGALVGNLNKSKPVKAVNVDTKSLAVKGAFGFLPIAGIKGKDVVQLMGEDRCEFREVFVDNEAKFAKTVSDNQKWFEALKDSDKNRVVTRVVVIKSCSIDDQFAQSHQGEFSGVIQGGKLDINSDESLESASSIDLAPGSVIGYMLGEPIYDKKSNKKATRITGWRTDDHG